ncbi:MAG: ATP phosphoribosyltransferase regulatory subunit, partial [Pseudomonadota bacterium]
QAHMAGGVEPARYAYQGAVWRKQLATSDRPREYAQIGIEVFDSADPGNADAEVFDRVMRALKTLNFPKGLGVYAGDVGLMQAAVASLKTSELRKAALMRHLWRPDRFDALLSRYAGEVDPPPGRETLSLDGLAEAISDAGPEIGLRRAADVAARVERLVADRAEPSLPASQVDALRSLQDMNIALDQAADAITKLASELPQIAPAVQKMTAWVEALANRGYDLSRIMFQGTYGLTSMEYYDGFVFGVSSGDQLVATGGRYDALTEVLGGGAKMAAVGAVIRPNTVAEVSS